MSSIACKFINLEHATEAQPCADIYTYALGTRMPLQPYYKTNREYESPLHEFRVARGLSVKELAQKTEVNPSNICALANGMLSPLLADGTLRTATQRLCDFFNTKVSTLFPRYVCDMNRSFKFDNMPFETWSERTAEHAFREFELVQTLNHLLSTAAITPMQLRIITCRYLQEMTLAEIAAKEGFTETRVRQVIEKGLTRLNTMLPPDIELSDFYSS